MYYIQLPDAIHVLYPFIRSEGSERKPHLVIHKKNILALHTTESFAMPQLGPREWKPLQRQEQGLMEAKHVVADAECLLDRQQPQGSQGMM